MPRSTTFRRSIFFFSVLLLVIESSSLFAQGALMINPKRIVFEGNKRNDIVTLFNGSDDTTSYAISFKHYEMQQNGDFKDIDSIKTDELFCDDMVKFFPREVTLPPRGSQTIRLQLLKPKDIKPGEYRSHLYFRSIERAKALEAPRSDTDKTISLNLKAIFGLAIPIIVRNQTSAAKVSLTNLTLSPIDTGGKTTLVFDINRTGDESLYGEFHVFYSDASTKDEEVGLVKGVGVYVPLPMRRFPVQLKMPAVISMGSGSLRVEYRTMTGSDKEAVLATAEMPLKK